LKTFEELNLLDMIQKNLARQDYRTPTPIQAAAIPPLLDGEDLIGCAQTGTGKTAAFCLPLLQRLAEDQRVARRRSCRALILSPTRELAQQIADSLQTYGRGLRLRHTVIYGGVGYGNQVQAMRNGQDIVVACPGRLLDLLEQGLLRLDGVECLILDEADRMLDMGFLPAIRRILELVPSERQTMLFSATMPPAIRDLAANILTDPVSVTVMPTKTTEVSIEQQLEYLDKSVKRDRLCELLADPEVERALVFTKTKHGAERLSKQLDALGFSSQAIHGDRSQNARQRALDMFRRGKVMVLVATDVAARGIDVDGISHVYNFDLPMEPENYVHRIGRTGRAGATGTAVSFCSPEEFGLLMEIEKLLPQPIPVTAGSPPERPRSQDQSRGKSRGRSYGKSYGNAGGRSYGKSNGKADRRPSEQSADKPYHNAGKPAAKLTNSSDQSHSAAGNPAARSAGSTEGKSYDNPGKPAARSAGRSEGKSYGNSGGKSRDWSSQSARPNRKRRERSQASR